MIKWIKKLLCDHDYRYVYDDYYRKDGQIVFYKRYICKKCGKHLIEEWRVKYEDRN